MFENGFDRKDAIKNALLSMLNTENAFPDIYEIIRKLKSYY